MKKLAILACVMTVSAGLAMAETVSIPFFADTNGSTSFVGLQNVSGGTITGSVTYNLAGVIEAGGTFALADGESFSFRPFATDASEVQPTTVNNASVGFGSIQIVTSGGPVAGRFVQFGAGGGFAHNVEVNP